ncbi:Ankyrin repeat-containing domain protein [Akanthomyces lecanii RCEF 1005]|uniref:Ankyrin repeat-containing domain protein n=1 Tax=Akanthomyces lecanii RCEF 1005 TaxID=1081108 RepID=A0A162N2E5_CORDF|nr:Ankyrin repeat-containing domain protein [Akanthomyces lecanii RCEF 1005]
MTTPNAGFQPPRPTARDDFKIAVICALPLEADAVDALFDRHWDEDGPSFDNAPDDPNAYSTGAIGRHNVVLAHMPGMGKGNAAIVANNCRISFPNLKLALVCSNAAGDGATQRVGPSRARTRARVGGGGIGHTTLSQGKGRLPGSDTTLARAAAITRRLGGACARQGFAMRWPRRLHRPYGAHGQPQRRVRVWGEAGATPWLGYSDRWSDTTYKVEYIVELLQEEDPEGEDYTEYCTTRSIIEEYRASVLTLLLSGERSDVAARDDEGATALHSVMYGDSTSPDITPLHLACFKSDAPAVVTLLDHGADVGAADDMRVNCLHYAAQSRHIKAVLPLLTAALTSYVGALPLAMSRDLRGRNALHHLIKGRKRVDAPAVQSLLDLGVKCDELNRDGMSPLACYLSVVRGAINTDEVIQLLFQGGSDATFKTRTNGLTLAQMHAKSAVQV